MAGTDSPQPQSLSSLMSSLKKRWFIIAVLLVIMCARVYPPIGAKSGSFASLCNLKVMLLLAPIVALYLLCVEDVGG